MNARLAKHQGHHICPFSSLSPFHIPSSHILCSVLFSCTQDLSQTTCQNRFSMSRSGIAGCVWEWVCRGEGVLRHAVLEELGVGVVSSLLLHTTGKITCSGKRSHIQKNRRIMNIFFLKKLLVFCHSPFKL